MIGNESTTIPNTTGMTEEQLAAAVQRFTGAKVAPQSIRSQVDFWASRLVPAECVVLSRADIAVVRRVRNAYAAWLGIGYPLTADDAPNRDDLDALSALIGDDNG